jgi:hypothetical protein
MFREKDKKINKCNSLTMQTGSALLMTSLVLGGFLLTSLTAAGMIFSGIQMVRVQTSSTKAFFAAEAGVEKALWEVRKNGYSLPGSDEKGIFSGTLDNGSTYSVDYTASTTNIITSIGEFDDTKRSVEVEW